MTSAQRMKAASATHVFFLLSTCSVSDALSAERLACAEAFGCRLTYSITGNATQPLGSLLVKGRTGSTLCSTKATISKLWSAWTQEGWKNLSKKENNLRHPSPFRNPRIHRALARKVQTKRDSANFGNRLCLQINLQLRVPRNNIFDFSGRCIYNTGREG